MKRLIAILLLLTYLIFPCFSLAKEPIRTIYGTVTRVSDGDTIQVTESKGSKVRVRLYGIDAPETEKSNKKTGNVSKPGQPYGEEAYQALQSKVLKKKVKLEVMAIDQYKRLVGMVIVDGRSINEEMVAEGNAWAYRQYLNVPYKSAYIGLEEKARGKKLGLWKQSNPEPPWAFRKRIKVR